jgi:ABC-type nitrate/sulfonate/bicarbonate transport system substrate-binding protein
MDTLRLAIDWTINTNHSGFIVAIEKGYYKQAGIELQIINPQDDNYGITPVKKLEKGVADLAICPTESILSYRVKSTPFEIRAIATIFQQDISAIATLRNSSLNELALLDNKTYASYAARYEDEIVKQAIRNAGGQGNIKLSYPDKLEIWDTLLENKCDATWIFINWEYVWAQLNGIELNLFLMKDVGIPYGYSPVIVAPLCNLQNETKLYEKFLEATSKGFVYAIEHINETAQILFDHIPTTYRNLNFLVKSQAIASAAYGNAQNWGDMDKDLINAFLNWLYNHQLESKLFNADDIVYRFNNK